MWNADDWMSYWMFIQCTFWCSHTCSWLWTKGRACRCIRSSVHSSHADCRREERACRNSVHLLVRVPTWVYSHGYVCVCGPSHPSWCSFSITSFLCRNRLLCLLSTNFPRQKTTLFLRCRVWEWNLVYPDDIFSILSVSPGMHLFEPNNTYSPVSYSDWQFTEFTSNFLDAHSIFCCLVSPCLSTSGFFCLTFLSSSFVRNDWLLTLLIDLWTVSMSFSIITLQKVMCKNTFIWLMFINVIKPNLFEDNRLSPSLSLNSQFSQAVCLSTSLGATAGVTSQCSSITLSSSTSLAASCKCSKGMVCKYIQYKTTANGCGEVVNFWETTKGQERGRDAEGTS